MAAPSNHPGRILPQDTEPGDANEEVISGEAVSLAEIEELLYSEDRPIALRIDRLQELADETRARAAGEIADADARSLLSEIEGAISVLEARAPRARCERTLRTTGRRFPPIPTSSRRSSAPIKRRSPSPIRLRKKACGAPGRAGAPSRYPALRAVTVSSTGASFLTMPLVSAAKSPISPGRPSR